MSKLYLQLARESSRLADASKVEVSKPSSPIAKSIERATTLSLYENLLRELRHRHVGGDVGIKVPDNASKS
jgi:hypothetical protein